MYYHPVMFEVFGREHAATLAADVAKALGAGLACQHRLQVDALGRFWQTQLDYVRNLSWTSELGQFAAGRLRSGVPGYVMILAYPALASDLATQTHLRVCEVLRQRTRELTHMISGHDGGRTGTGRLLASSPAGESLPAAAPGEQGGGDGGQGTEPDPGGAGAPPPEEPVPEAA